jgi:hypothetical protein
MNYMKNAEYNNSLVSFFIYKKNMILHRIIIQFKVIILNCVNIEMDTLNL